MTPIVQQDQPSLIIMRPSKRKWIGVMLLCLAFVFLSVVRIADDGVAWIDNVVIPLFGLGALVAASQLVPGWNELRLDAEGFSVVRLGFANRTRWLDVAGDFTTCEIYRTTLVMFSLNPGVGKARWAHKANLQLCGQTHGLPDTYGPSAEDLAGLMSSLRHKAARRLA